MPPTFQENMQSPDVSLSTYARRKRLALAHSLNGQQTIYLDTKYWIMLRDVRLGRSSCPDVLLLLDKLESGVANKQLICPFNADIFFEVLKQSDTHTLSATAQLIDKLSTGVCLMPMHSRFELEFFHFIESCRQTPDAIHPLKDLVWSKTAYVLGFLTPHFSTLPAEVDEAIQKSFMDHMWTLGFSDLLDVLGAQRLSRMQEPFLDVSSQLNSGKFAHLDEHTSFKGVFLSEVVGILDVYRDHFSQIIQYIYQRDTGQQLTEADKEYSAGAKMYTNLIFHAFRLNRLTHHLPSLRVAAGLHAAVRWDRARQYKPNDMFDFHHAIAALPYCDLFLTERPLCHLLNNGHLKFNEHFTCKSVHRPIDALALVRGS